jgi:uncharacterized protein YndB with AHSA1/START domain
MTDPDVLEVAVHIAASPETVFPYFTDPDRYVEWMGDRATVDPVPGGPYRVRVRGGVEAAGEFVEVDPPKRIVFTWGWTDDHAGRRYARGRGRRHPCGAAPLRPAE